VSRARANHFPLLCLLGPAMGESHLAARVLSYINILFFIVLTAYDHIYDKFPNAKYNYNKIGF
jgi:hypothetical protein